MQQREFKQHWLPVEYRIQFKTVLLTYNALNGFSSGLSY
uniref:Uncharacterized protein n=1 Tax=Anguilla anguilla TaxID=7936 RepID=A0A0E9U628_ANGAN